MAISSTAPRPSRPARPRRVRVRVTGAVQGVGFRPYVFGLARELGLGGFVSNDVGGVFIEAEGARAAVELFLDRLACEAPSLATVERVDARDIQPVGDARFAIAASGPGGAHGTLVTPDAATCGDCLRELADPVDRRFGYPFINCTNCGPRYTIVRGVPYDRPLTTMVDFALCADCAREYNDPAGRRFHAQPICCPACGPQLRLISAAREPIAGEPIAAAARLLREGGIVAVKGLGGYHLAVDAASENAAARLRARKHREEKPFAIMIADLAAARELCEVDAREAALLCSSTRPITLLRRREDAPVAAAVAPGSRWLGLMLPYTPLHHLLVDDLPGPFVLTSGNVSDEPIAYRDADALDRLAYVADAFLTHDRPIHMRVGDSVARVVAGRLAPLRRSRGWAPHPVTVPWDFPRHVLACGAELESTVCLAKGRHAFLSHHIGDLKSFETFRSFTQAIEHLEGLFDITPEVVAHDLHPEYVSTKHAQQMEGVELVGVQHHHAHIASCLSDRGHPGPVIGVAFDGPGYGTDQTVWGGEILRADLVDFERLGHLEAVPMPGGAAAIREPWRMAAVWLDAAFQSAPPDGLDVARRNAERWDGVLQAAAAGINAPRTSSAGRLFDAVAAILGIRDTANYEGQAAFELEQAADPGETGEYPSAITGKGPFRCQPAGLVRGVVTDLRRRVETAVIAARFHNGVAALIAAACQRAREVTGLSTAALSGAAFQNVLLTERTVTRLSAEGFTVLTHAQVPCNDGGISLGQAAVAAARDRAGLS